MKIAVVGTGYVGLVTGTCFAEMGNTVTCVDIDENKVKQMRSGKVPIYEPDLENLFSRNISEKRLSFTTDLSSGIKDAQVVFLALPTPPGEDGSADLSYVLSVAKDIGPLLNNYAVIVDKSTVPVGTAEKVRDKIAESATVDFDVASNPEFLREGFAVSDFLKPDRIVIGTTSNRARKLLDELYIPFVRQGSQMIHMDERSAEITKYAANTFLAMKISFMNEMANLSEKLGADIDMVREGIGADDRIGSRFLYPGIGYGGSCFPKDVLALHKISEEKEYDFKLIDAVMKVNTQQKKVLVKKIREFYKDDLRDKTFALWGLAFKPDTDDIREAPALEIIDELVDKGAKITAYDPEAAENVKRIYSGSNQLQFSETPYDALRDADALIIATEWGEFRTPDFKKIKKTVKSPVIFDGRNIYDLDAMEAEGFYYTSIGRRVVDGR